MLKRFIKDYGNTTDPEVRHRYATVAGVFGIVTNLALGVFKLIIGLLSRSISIMADAVNNISDCASSCLTIIGFTLSSKEPDSEHPYGHARYEYVFGFAIGIIMFVMGVIFAKESIQKIINPQELSIGINVYLTLFLAIIVKLLQMFVYRDFSRSIQSPALDASATDARNDIISTSGILVAMVVMGITGYNIDGFIGFAISIFVMISSFETIKDEIEPLIGIKPTPERVKMITDKIMSYPVALGIHDLVLHNYGVHNDFVTVHVEVDANRSMLETHDLIDIIEMDFKRDLGISMTIHMDPIVIGNEKLDNIKDQVSKALAELDPQLRFHDMRMVEGPTHTNIIFDCVVSPDHRYTARQLAKYLEGKVSYDCVLCFVIEIDIPYC